MARKRMISPEIWTSRNFSELSNFEKIVFISLFSHADDEGRGEADPTYISSMTFPYDKNRRDSDVKKALTTIARTMSVQLYSVNGNDYYYMTSWKRWQKIDKPSKSKLPPPPSVGEGGAIPKTEKFDEHSTNTPRTLDEPSATINRNKYNRIPPSNPPAGEEEREGKAEFMEAYPLLAAWKKYDDSGVDYKVLSEQFANSSRLRKTYSMKWVCDNYQAIANGVFADKPDNEITAGEWDNWLLERRNEAERVAENALARADADHEYHAAHKELSALTISLAMAEVKGNGQQTKIKTRMKELKELERARLTELGINEADFTPKYHCKHCGDTGFLPDGHMCKDCWEKFKESRP